MVKIPEYKPKTRGVTTDEVSEGEHKAVITDVETTTKQREKRIWDQKLKAKVVAYDDNGQPVIEDYELLETSYEITDVDGHPVIHGLDSLSMNPGDEEGNMRSNLYKNALALGEVPKKGQELDTDRFIGRHVVVKVKGKQTGDITWANIDGPIVRADGGKQRSFEDDAQDPSL